MECIQRKKEPVLGFEVDLLSFEESLQLVHQYLKENKGMQIVTINPEIISWGKKNDEYGRIIKEADLVIPESIGIKLALKINGINQDNIPGVEFSQKLIQMCELEGFSVGFLGAKEEVVQKATKNIQEKHKNINITYIRNGYFDLNEEEIIAQELKAISPRVIFVALGVPKQEFMIAKLKKDMPTTVFIGVGGSFDVWAGVVKRAPKIWQKLGLEWLYRTIQEPERFKRIFPALPLFLVQVIIESIKKNWLK